MGILHILYEKYKAYKDPIGYCRNLGAKIGENCVLKPKMLSSEPWLINIGNHVLLAEGVQILTHDGAGWALGYGQDEVYYDIWGKVTIGNNVYVGVDAIILPNVCITDNVIIGAGSIVTKDIKEDGVYVGRPAKRIKSFDEWKKGVNCKVHNTYGMTMEEKKKYFESVLK